MRVYDRSSCLPRPNANTDDASNPKRKPRIQALILAALVTLLTSCGSGGPGNITNTTTTTPPPTLPPHVVLTISPNNITVNQGATQPFVASGDAVTWSVSEGAAGGSISSSGLYTAPNRAGTFHVVATSQSNPSASTAAAVTVPKVGIGVVSPLTMAKTESDQLAGYVGVTGTVNFALSWSVQEGTAGGTITAAGMYTAPAALGTYHVVVTSQADSTASAVIAIVVAPVTVTVSPVSDVLGPSGVRSFSATLNSINQSVTWSVQEGAAGGITSAAGTYTAPNATGIFHVIATSVFDPTAQAVATVTVVGSGFRPTGDMKDNRSAHTATLLPSGKVLVTNGDGCYFVSYNYYYYGSCPTKDAELFDPTTGTFTIAGQTSQTHVSHTATLLCSLGTTDPAAVPCGSGNTKVLIAGGGSGAELYDPSSGNFSDTGAMVSSRSSHTATLLQNGKVLIAGGYPFLGSITATAELYDPKSGTFTATGAMTTARAQHTATLLTSGKVLITGGGNNLASAESYDPATGTFSVTGSMATGRSSHSATLLKDGKVLIAGGANSATAELYDPATGTFSSTGSMVVNRNSHVAVLLSSGNVLIAGGFDANFLLYTAELYDPVTQTFTQTGSMRDARALAAAVLLQDGRVLVTGGSDLNSAEIFQ